MSKIYVKRNGAYVPIIDTTFAPTYTSDLVLHNPTNGATPALWFRRMSETDSYTDYKLYGAGGNFYIDKSVGGTTSNMLVLNESGDMAYKGYTVVTKNNLKTINGSSVYGTGDIVVAPKLPKFRTINGVPIIYTDNRRHINVKVRTDHYHKQETLFMGGTIQIRYDDITVNNLTSATAMVYIEGYKPTVFPLHLHYDKSTANVICQKNDGTGSTNFYIEHYCLPQTNSVTFMFKYTGARQIYNEAYFNIPSIIVKVTISKVSCVISPS